MSADDTTIVEMHDDLFADYGTDATVKRGTDAAEPVRIILTRGQEQIGEYGQVVARVDWVDVRIHEWTWQQGDVVTWTDRLGTHSKAIERQAKDDGYVATAVLYG